MENFKLLLVHIVESYRYFKNGDIDHLIVITRSINAPESVTFTTLWCYFTNWSQQPDPIKVQHNTVPGTVITREGQLVNPDDIIPNGRYRCFLPCLPKSMNSKYDDFWLLVLFQALNAQVRLLRLIFVTILTILLQLSLSGSTSLLVLQTLDN